MGRDCQPRVGMTVKLTAQALERRAENGRADPSKGGTGVIVKCHPNWTCDVMWCVAACAAPARDSAPFSVSQAFAAEGGDARA